MKNYTRNNNQFRIVKGSLAGITAISTLMLLGFSSPSLFGQNRALYLPGDCSWVTVPSNPSLNLRSNFTLEAWINFEVGGTWHPRIISRGWEAPAYELYTPHYESANRVVGFMAWTNVGGFSVNSSRTITAGSWTHVAGTYDGHTARVFINGQLQGTVQAVIDLPDSTKTLAIGRNSQYENDCYKGLIDEVRVWNRALTAAEIQANMHRTLSGTENGLVAYWNFDDATAKDLTTNHNDGTFVSSASTAEAALPPIVNAEIVPGLTVLGSVGSVCAIQSTTNVSETSDWQCLTFLKLPTSPYLWTDTGTATGRRFYRAVKLDVPTNMVCIQPGTFQPGIFTMGSSTNEEDRYPTEGPQTTVRITRGFLMGMYEVTQQEYQSVMGNNPSHFTGDPSLPVENQTWADATNYCGQLTEKERLLGRLPAGCRYRLPTEAEWEYACRAGTTTRFSYGDDPGYTNLGMYAWYDANSGAQTHLVGQKTANPWGLYDMYGNVWEWCQDWLGDYPGGYEVDPQGPGAGSYLITRGGGWDYYGRRCRSAARSYYLPTEKAASYGLRVVLAPNGP